MMIRVMYNDGRFDMVVPSLLDQLLRGKMVASFQRATGWAVVGRDPVRGSGGTGYHGADRRAL